MKTETNVGDKIQQQEGGWVFDDDVADTFDKHVKRSIPNYNAIQDQVIKLADWYLTGTAGETVYDLGCATGTTLKLLLERRDRGEDTTYIGIDEAKPMLEKAREKLNSYDNVRLVEQDLTNRPGFTNATVIISLFTLSFLPEDERRKVVQRAYDDLQSGGALIFIEKTYPEAARFQAIFREHYFDYKQTYFDPEEVIGKAASLRGQLRPLTVMEYRQMLSDAGFEDIQPWYQWYMWWGVIVRKQ